MKASTVAITAAIAVASFEAGRMFPLNETPPEDQTADWMSRAEGPSNATLKQFKKMEEDFETDNLYGEENEKRLDTPTTESQRPVLFQNKIVPMAAKALYEDNEQLKLMKAPEADMSPEAQNIGYWVAKLPLSVFWKNQVKQAEARRTAADTGPVANVVSKVRSAVIEPIKTKLAEGYVKGRQPSKTGYNKEQLPGKTGYNNEPVSKASALSKTAPVASGEIIRNAAMARRKAAEEATLKLAKLASEKGALEGERRAVIDRKEELERESLAFKEKEEVLNADLKTQREECERLKTWSERLTARKEQLDNEGAGKQLPFEEAQRVNAMVNKYAAEAERYETDNTKASRKNTELEERQKSLDEKLQTITDEKERLNTKEPQLTEKIDALIKEETEARAQMFGSGG